MTNINGQVMSTKSMAELGKESVTAMFRNTHCVRCVERLADLLPPMKCITSSLSLKVVHTIEVI
jgi:hypothetical protein